MSKKNVVASMATIAFFGICAKVLGLVREGVFGAYFGTSSEMDLFGLLSGYATTLITLLGNALASSYYPFNIKNIEQKGERYAANQFSKLLNQYAVFSLIVYVAIFIFASDIAEIVCSSGVTVPFHRVKLYVRVIFAVLVPAGMTRLVVSGLTSLRKYGWMQITQSVYSVVAILLTLMFSNKYGIIVVVWAFMLNTVFQIILLCFVYYKGERKYELCFDIKDEQTVAAWRGLVPVAIGADVFMIGATIDRSIGISLGLVGASASLSYAGTLYGSVIALVATPVKTVFNTEMNRKFFSDGNKDDLFAQIESTFNHMAILLVPICFFLSVAAHGFITIVLQRGAFDEYSTQLTASTFMVYILIAPIFAMRELLNGLHVLLNDRVSSMYSGLIFVVANASLSFAFSKVFGLVGIPLGSMSAMMLSYLYLFMHLRIKHGCQNKIINSTLLKIIFAGVLGIVGVWCMRLGVSVVSVYLRFVLELFIFLFAYILMLKISKCEELNLVFDKLKKQIHEYCHHR